jgi:DNA-binding GntR family transcriptional regulator
MRLGLDPLSTAVLAAFTAALVPADDLTIHQIARALGLAVSDPGLRWALEDLEQRGLLHRHGDRRWHLQPRITRNAIYEPED